MCTLAAVVVFPAVLMIWVQWAACTVLLMFFHMFCNELNLITQGKIIIFPTQPVLCAKLLRKIGFGLWKQTEEMLQQTLVPVICNFSDLQYCVNEHYFFASETGLYYWSGKGLLDLYQPLPMNFTIILNSVFFWLGASGCLL